ncbi:glycoside hydrolase family 15 protein [Streptomyces silvisoli]|uniref:Glycoside hydrolase family 15 protein n=1 Tax=Streptomyces silvisoli TaxID=3034235 RepID=A0ABT5ZDB2_9ACTN|nr:glycoside hydrolase family 15 protein [Streptomyces silvisoli]MDF3287803.1 glycoside hydrolase family 15 protein [Streptomyces silvisoli]
MSLLQPPTGHSVFPPQQLRDYAMLADGERGALVGPRGEICWLCAPHWDGDAVFATLIGGDGVYAVTPRGPFVSGGYYEEGSLIWRSRWITHDSIIECREALAFPGENDRLVLLRRVMARQGTASVRVVLCPCADYGRQPLSDPHNTEGVWTARTGEHYIRWSGGADARLVDSTGPGRQLVLDLALETGEQHDLVLEISTTPPRGRPVDATRAWTATEQSWAHTIPPLNPTIAPHDASHAYAVLRGMTSATGGMVAAATTSLPERAEQGRNYDYRYVWIRDQCYAGQAAAAAGAHPLLDAAVRFVTAQLHTHGPQLKPAYTTHGGPVPDQRSLDLPGYPGGFDRIGNHINRQFQLDAFGEALLLLAAAARAGRLDDDGWKGAELAAATIETRWREPDAGIWELDDQAWTHSRLICVAGLRGMAAVAPRSRQARRWSALAETIFAATAAASLHPNGYWQRSPNDSRLDAALLLPPLRGALPADDPRTRTTLHAYRQQLTDRHHAYRFRHDDRPLEEAEGAFLLCGFVMALAEHRQGNEIAAHTWFERNRAAHGPAQLYSEEYDIAQHQLRGNLPQAFVHAFMLESAARLAAQPP